MMAQRVFVPAPPFPPAYGRAATIALGLGLFGGFVTGLYALGVPAFGGRLRRTGRWCRRTVRSRFWGLPGC